MLLVAGAAGWETIRAVIKASRAIALPDQMASLPRTHYLAGRQAAQEFISLHGEPVPLTSGSLACTGQ